MADSPLRTKQGDSLPRYPRVYKLPPAPISMKHGCWACGYPFEEHVGDALFCPCDVELEPQDRHSDLGDGGTA